MSKEFLQYMFPCETCLVQAACQDRDAVKESMKGTYPNRPSLAVPHFDDITYFKGVIECIINLQIQIMNAISKLEGPDKRQHEDNLPMNYLHILHTMSQISGYIINSTSWEDGKLYEFDRFEVAHKLQRLKAFM